MVGKSGRQTIILRTASLLILLHGYEILLLGLLTLPGAVLLIVGAAVKTFSKRT